MSLKVKKSKASNAKTLKRTNVPKRRILPKNPYSVEEYEDHIIIRMLGDINYDQDWKGSFVGLSKFSEAKVTCVLNRHGETEIVIDPTPSRDPSKLDFWKDMKGNLCDLPTKIVDRNMQRRAAKADPYFLVDTFKDHMYSKYLNNPKTSRSIRNLSPGKKPVELSSTVKVHMPSWYTVCITVKGKKPTTIHMPIKIQNIHALHRYTELLVGVNTLIGEINDKDPNRTPVNIMLMDTQRAGSRSSDPGTNREGVISNAFSNVDKNPDKTNSSVSHNVDRNGTSGPSKHLEFHLNNSVKFQVPQNCVVFANFGILHGSFPTKNRSKIDNMIGLHRDNEANNYKFGGKQYGFMIRCDDVDLPGFPSSMCWLFYYSKKNTKIKTLDEDTIRRCPYLTRYGYETYVLKKRQM